MRDPFFRIIVVLLLLVNTFFIGGIWCAMTYQTCGYKKASFCPLSKKTMGKICPITGKQLQAFPGDSM